MGVTRVEWDGDDLIIHAEDDDGRAVKLRSVEPAPYCPYCSTEFPDRTRNQMPSGLRYGNGWSFRCPACGEDNVA